MGVTKFKPTFDVDFSALFFLFIIILFTPPLCCPSQPHRPGGRQHDPLMTQVTPRGGVLRPPL
jgi:hypothetical protein